MAYTSTDGVNPTIPVGSTTPAATIDTQIQIVKRDGNERLNGVMGVNWAVDDPILPSKYGPNVNISDAQVYGNIIAKGNASASQAIDWDDGHKQHWVLTQNTTFTFTNTKVGAVYELYIEQNGTGGWSITLPVICKQGSAAFSTGVLLTGASTLSILGLTVFNSATAAVSVITTGTSTS